MKLRNPNWLSSDVQSHIDPPQIPLNRAAPENTKECDIIKIKMCRDPASATLETYELKISTFDNGKPVEFLRILNNFKTVINGTGNITPDRIIDYLHTLLCGESLSKFDELVSQVTVKTNNHIDFIKESLVGFFSVNALTKQKRAMRRVIRKP